MKPCDVPDTDRYMYYNDTWLMHRDLGPIHVTVVDYEFRDEEGEELDETLLDHWFPRGGAYQRTRRSAVYIERTAARNMRKSASLCHYRKQYGDAKYESLLSIMSRPQKYHTCDTELKNNESIVVSRDIIFHKIGDSTHVIYKGRDVGLYTPTGFDPSIVRDPMCKRAYYQLQQEAQV